MPQFRIEPMPSRRLNSDKVVYYVKDAGTNKMVTKFDTDSLEAERVEGWVTFSPEQKLELRNYIANLRFAIEKLQLPAKLNRDYRFSLPEPLQTALVKLFDKAQQHNINFDPMSAMLNGLLNHITTTEKRLQSVGESSVLSQHGLTIVSENKTEQDKEIRKYSKKIFKHLSTLKNGLEAYAKLALELYDKETNLNSSTVAKYSEGKAKPSQWSISCALSVLGHQDNITTIAPINILISLWITPLKFSGKIKTTKQATNLLKQTFTLTKKDYEEAVKVIDIEMMKIT